MPAPPNYEAVFGFSVLPLESRSAGTYTSDSLISSTSIYPVSDVEIWVYVSDVSGSPTLDCSLESSTDGTTWTAIPYSGIPSMTSQGNAVANAPLPSTSDYVRVTSTVSGSDSSMTYRVLAIAALVSS